MSSGSNSSRVKKGKLKQKLVFSKNKNQTILAIVVIVVFFGITIHNITKYFRERNSSPITARNEQTTETNTIIGQQQENLKDLTEQEQNNIVDNNQNQDIAQEADNIYSQTLNLQKGSPNQDIKTFQNSEGDIEIIPKKNIKKSDKMVVISVTNTYHPDPFLPDGDNLMPIASTYSYLPPPPTNFPVDSDASKVITTTISGILYDKYSPSAIINIEGTDYLVKKGDVINNYKILSIGKTQVIVQLGKNVYKAGVGELLSQTDLNYNTVANLNKKFGGNDISINVKKKGY